MRELTQHGVVNVSHLASLLSVAEGSGVGGVREFGATQEVLLAPVSSHPHGVCFLSTRPSDSRLTSLKHRFSLLYSQVAGAR